MSTDYLFDWPLEALLARTSFGRPRAFSKEWSEWINLTQVENSVNNSPVTSIKTGAFSSEDKALPARPHHPVFDIENVFFYHFNRGPHFQRKREFALVSWPLGLND
ncbi:hypothetical protein EVAR_103179_1 [Eumeta japonica]|uniref:Uncharacterized protein n=1 Tax=Eumeta variegata TaxID=151549 RepID=A0A4C1YH09_EUMVA|nr:hypothetical protein EVAR_103179_1 [Eumeta japonica]